MTNILTKKFTKLRKELQYWQSELEYIQEVLKEWHLNFEEQYRQYCKDNNIDIPALEKQNRKKLDKILPNSPVQELIAAEFHDSREKKYFKNIYKQIAKKIHPDVGGDEEEFKSALNAFHEKNLEKLLDICDKNVILVDVDDDIIELLQNQISETKEKIDKEKSTYSWSLFSCDGNEKCAEKVFKKFLMHLFNYKEK